MNTSKARRAAVVLVSTTLCLGLCEAFSRLWLGPSPAPEEEKFWRYDPELGWRNKQSFSARFRNPTHGYDVTVSFDAEGFRENGSPRLDAPELKVLVVGDSTSVGMEVDDEKTFPALLERRLRAAEIKANVYNSAVRGYGTDQVMLTLKKLVPVVKPDVVIYMGCGCGNDLLGNITVKGWYRAFSKPVFGLDQGRLVPFNRPPATYGSGVYAYLMHDGGALRIESGYIKKTGLFSWLRLNSALFTVLDGAYYGYVKRSPFNAARRDPAYEQELFGTLLSEMNGAAKSFYASSLAKPLGFNKFKFGYEQVSDIVRARGIEYLDIQPYFKQGVRYDFGTDSHWNEAGHAQGAEAFFKELARQGVLKRWVDAAGARRR
ncbi:MAG: hypothetical protein HY059_18605 [Proteobacteria bacterium]|nr:hypothetical protein [Pseudomonadota bacterium]